MLVQEVLLNEFKRTHLEHIEDLVVIDGYQGGKNVIEYFRGLLLTLKGTSSEAVSVSVKWDGAPAIVCGTNPDNGKFFVGTKSVFNKRTPLVNYTKGDIAKNHGTDQLGQKLLKCLVHLKKINIQGVLQGDMMFTDNDLEKQNIGGKPHLTFTPNTITYAVEENSEIGKIIAQAKVGVVFHTTYVGDELSEMSAQAGADISGFTQNSDVWLDNAVYKDVSGSAKFTAEETKSFVSQIEQLEKLLEFVPRDLQTKMQSNPDFQQYFMLFINDQVKAGKLPTDANVFLKDFQQFYQNRMKDQIAGLKAQKALALRQQKIKDMPQFLSQLRKPLQAMLSFYKQVQSMKAMVLKKMNQAMGIGSFSQTDNGLEVTEPEGYVAVDKSGSAVKLVDRLVFSRRNLTMIKKFGR